jgi:hypothetical protein
MEQVYPPPPFERRTILLAIVASRIAMGWLGTTAAHRSHVLNSTRDAVAAHGLSNSLLAVLNGLSISYNSATLVFRRTRQASRKIFA